MGKKLKYTLAGLFFTGMLVLIGVTKTDKVNEPSQAPAMSAISEQGPVKKDSTRLSINSTIGELVADENAKAILDEHLPGMSSDPQMQQAMGMSLRQMAPYSQGWITNEILKAIGEELNSLPRAPGAGSQEGA